MMEMVGDHHHVVVTDISQGPAMIVDSVVLHSLVFVTVTFVIFKEWRTHACNKIAHHDDVASIHSLPTIATGGFFTSMIVS